MFAQNSKVSLSHSADDSILDQVYYELSIFIGMFIMVFGIMLGANALLNNQADLKYTSSFTDAAAKQAETQIVSSIQTLAEDYFFTLGYTGDADILANFFAEFVGIDSQYQELVQPVYTAERERFEDEGVVLGAESDSPDL